MSVTNLLKDIHNLANPERAKISQRFFKTGKGQYGEGDIFLGLTMPQTRELVKKHIRTIKLEDVETLLADKHHEIRMAGVLLLIHMAKNRELIPEIVELYLTARPGVNNWDLVDVSSEYIIGQYMESYLDEGERKIFIEDFILSKNLWINRIIVLASFHFIKKGDAAMIYQIAERFFDHKHDLMHKAVGWMLREAGKRCSESDLKKYLDKYASKMPRTMLRYAIERLEQESRQKYMNA